MRKTAPHPLRTSALAALFSCLTASAATPPTEQQLEFFEKSIRPVLISECYECHGAKQQKGGLRVDYRDGLLQGGDSGASVVPGKPKESLLIRSVTHEDEDLQMPQKRPKLGAKVIADLSAWVEMGAPDPRDKPLSESAAGNEEWAAKFALRKQWWSFQPLQKPPVPAVRDNAWSDHPVDRFLLAKLEHRNLSPAPPAEKRTLLRRASFALTGLPPSVEELERFANDSSPHSFARSLDPMLASPAFGERWARFWMDLVRYADSHGSEGDPEIPFAWRYRDYLIRALNQDVPWDQLIREHIAGDLLPNPRWNKDEEFNESMLGASNLRFVEHGFQPIDALDDQVKVVDNQIDVLSKAFQALTVSCARCHDHKFDPVSQEDFYALYGVFASCRPAIVTIDAPARLRVHRTELRELKSRIKDGLSESWQSSPGVVSERLLASLPESAPSWKPSPAEEAHRRISDLRQELASLERIARDNHWRGRTSKSTSAPSALRAPAAVWDFERGADDLFGNLHGEFLGGAETRNGRLILNGNGAFVRTAPLTRDIREKTLEAWVALPKRDQGGGGVITIETGNGAVFDSIVYAEKEAGRWMAGSDFGNRTQPAGGPAESSAPDDLIHLAIVYSSDHTIRLFRNGQAYGSAYAPESETGQLRTYPASSARILFGLRHTGGDRGFLTGEIEEARLYDLALSPDEIKASHAAGPSRLNPAELAAALDPSQAAEHRRLTRDIATLQSEFEAKFPHYESERKARVQQQKRIEAAATDKLHPLHAWAVLRSLPDSEVASRWPTILTEMRNELEARKKSNAESFRMAWDFTNGDGSKWFRQGPNPPEASSTLGELSIEPSGDAIVRGLLPPGVYTHLLSQKHNGVFASPRFKVETDSISLRVLGGKGARVRLIVENYPLGNPGIFPQSDINFTGLTWLRVDTSYRKGAEAYLEIAPAEDQAAFSRPAAGPGGRSYFGVEKIVFHDGSKPPSEETDWPSLLSAGPAPRSLADVAAKYSEAAAVSAAAWQSGKLNPAQRALLDFLIRDEWLPARTNDLPALVSLVARYRELEESIPAPRRAPGVVETVAYNAPFLPRGDHTKPGAAIPRRYLGVIGTPQYDTAASGRQELARDVADPRNPLTARVMVNRVWQQLFGRGLVDTVDNFGLLGNKPTHPELLDYLAGWFIENGWSAKKLIRFLAESRAYQMSGAAPERAAEVDPGNELISHIRPRRLEAEAIYDNLLAVSGRLDSTPYGPGFSPFASPEQQKRRAVYVAIRRTNLSPFLEVFNAPKPFTTQGRRETTNVPAQSLALLNDPLVANLALAWARAVIAEGADEDARIRRMFERAFARPPSDPELAASREYLADLARENDAESAALSNETIWAEFAQSLFNFKEFIYLQ